MKPIVADEAVRHGQLGANGCSSGNIIGRVKEGKEGMTAQQCARAKYLP
jgi:hypothetical protein